MDLYTPVKLGYSDKKEQKDGMLQYGYYRDNSLSNANEQVYWNPTEHKLLVNVSGTHFYDQNGNFSLSDVGTDAYLAAGHLKETERYKEGKDILDKSKRKYGVDNAIVTGHSLGAGVANGIASGKDKVYNVDSAYTIGQKARENVKNYNTKGDIVSLFSPWGNSQTLANPTWKTGNWLWDTYNAHGVDNIKNQPIYIDDGMSSIPIDNSNQRRYLVPT